MDRRINKVTIELIIKKGLCTGCGTCAGICPNNAIEIKVNRTKGIYQPMINNEECLQCGLCYDACPGDNLDMISLNQQVFGCEPENILLGNYKSCSAGYATDNDIRYSSSSGGLVTSLLIFALEKGLIDGALVTRMNANNPLEPEPFIAKTKEEIIQASGSKYCPVSVNSILKLITQNKGRFAIVGLPCHIHGIRKAEQINKELNDKIVLHLGIFCNHTPNFWGTELFLERLGLNKEDILKINYRGDGWPGKMSIHTKKTVVHISQSDYWSFTGSSYFTSSRCLLCSDHTAELADLSFGDAWLKQFNDDKIGHSLVISRTEYGNRLLQMALNQPCISLTPVTTSEIIKSQLTCVYLKKKALKSRLVLIKNRPLLNSRLLNSDLIDYIINIWLYLSLLLSQNKMTRLLLRYLPLKLLYLPPIPPQLLQNTQLRKFSKQVNIAKEG